MIRRRVPGPRQRFPISMRSAQERRSYLVSFGLVVLLQAAISGALVYATVQTYHMWKHGVPYVSSEVARMVPGAFLAGSALALTATFRTLRRLRALRRLPLEPAPAEPSGDTRARSTAPGPPRSH
jgi:hypothetical protein